MLDNRDNMVRSRASWTRWIICSLVLLTGAADFFSFFIEPKFQIFDMSLLTVWNLNIATIFLIKFGVIFGLCYLLLYVKTSSDYAKFLWIMVAVYLIIFQTVGTISNRQVAAQNPPVESAPSEEVRTQVGINFALIWAYYPIAFSMLSFWLWCWGWKREE